MAGGGLVESDLGGRAGLVDQATGGVGKNAFAIRDELSFLPGCVTLAPRGQKREKI